jgi:MscS family membrane protein
MRGSSVSSPGRRPAARLSILFGRGRPPAARYRRKMRHAILLALICCAGPPAFSQAPPPARPDPQGRDNPRSAVAGFLEAARSGDYRRASLYLDLRQIPERNRARRGPELARELEAILNSDPRFDVSQLTRDPEGNGSDTARVSTVSRERQNFPINLEHTAPQTGAARIWLFASDTVVVIPRLTPATAPPWIVRFLPPFLVKTQLLETPLWKWIALVLVVLLLFALSRRLDRLLHAILDLARNRFGPGERLQWLGIIVQPLRVMFCLAVFRVALEFITLAAIARLYIGRATEVVLVWSIAWCLVRLVGLFFNRLETILDPAQRFASRSMLHLGRRTANFTIVVFAILLVLSSWGYNTNTLIAGLGVGGIAVALAAQQTIANVFGGVSIIGDHPVGIGEFGKFGDLVGTVEDIGMRSTRIRTLNRTIVSVQNSSFAALNLENYSQRDKILFNPVFEIKRGGSQDEVRLLMDSIGQALSKNETVDTGTRPVRLVGLTAAAFRLEIFCYVRTPDIDEFYKIQGELLLAIDIVLKNSRAELA